MYPGPVVEPDERDREIEILQDRLDEIDKNFKAFVVGCVIGLLALLLAVVVSP